LLEDLILFDSEAMQGDMHEQTAVGNASAYAALVLGTRDYVQKCGFSRVVIGLSGGIIPLSRCHCRGRAGQRECDRIAMPSQYSSEHILKDARELGVQARHSF